MELWARSLAAGIDDAVFWGCTPAEVGMLLRARQSREERQERAANTRAGLVTSAVYNVHRKKGKRPLKPEDFLAQEPKPLTPSVIEAWAKAHNREVADA